MKQREIHFGSSKDLTLFLEKHKVLRQSDPRPSSATFFGMPVIIKKGVPRGEAWLLTWTDAKKTQMEIQKFKI